LRSPEPWLSLRLVRPVQRALVTIVITFLAAQLMAQSPPVLKIAITRSGAISADGEPTTLDALLPILRDLAAKKALSGITARIPRAIHIPTPSKC
jgi:hypothetical protein